MKFGFKIIFLAALSILTLSLFSCSRETPEQRQARILTEIDSTVKTAQMLIFEEKYANAVELLEKALANYGDNSKIFEALGYAYSGAQKPEMAGMYFEKAGDLDSSNPDLYLSAAYAYEQANIIPAAAGAYKKYLKAVPNSGLALKKLAKCLEKQDLFEEAINTYFAAIKASGRSATSEEAASIGALFVKTKNYTQAERWLNAALDATLAENVAVRSTIYSAMIQMYLAKRDMAKLQEVYAELKKINSQLLESLYPNLGKEIDEYNQKLKEAEEAIKKANEAKILEEKRLAEEKKKAEELKKAEEEEAKKAEEAKLAAIKASEEVKNQEALTEAPEPVLTPEEREEKEYADNYEKGDYPKAEKVAQNMVAKKPFSSTAWRNLSKSYAAQGKNRDAFFAAREAMRNSPDDVAETLLYLSAASKVLNNETYLDNIYQAKERFPNNCEIMLGLARTYALVGNKTEAKYAYEQFFKLADRQHPLRLEADAELQKLNEETEGAKDAEKANENSEKSESAKTGEEVSKPTATQTQTASEPLADTEKSISDKGEAKE